MKGLFWSCCLLLCCMSCKSSSELGQLVGANRDEHGCQTTAGYVWSEALHQCVRLWEAGTRFESGNQTAFVIFNVDSTQAEVFTHHRAYLCKRLYKAAHQWKAKKAAVHLQFCNGIWCLEVERSTYTPVAHIK